MKSISLLVRVSDIAVLLWASGITVQFLSSGITLFVSVGDSTVFG